LGYLKVYVLWVEVCVIGYFRVVFGCVHGASGRCSGVALCCFFSKCEVTMSINSFGVVCICFVVGFVRDVTLDWSLALGTSPACILRLLW